MVLILLAAGDSRRFNGNKLLHIIGDKPMYRHIADEIDTLPDTLFEKKIVVTQYNEIMEVLGKRGYHIIVNNESFKGISHSIELGLEAAGNMESPVCFAVCDQPYLRGETIKQLIAGWKDSKKGIGALSVNGEAGNPVIFSKKYYAELMALTGDKGGKRILRMHMKDVYLYEIENHAEVEDIDERVL